MNDFEKLTALRNARTVIKAKLGKTLDEEPGITRNYRLEIEQNALDGVMMMIDELAYKFYKESKK